MPSTENSSLCLECGKSIQTKRSNARYCSSTCRSRASREMANITHESNKLLPILYRPLDGSKESLSAEETDQAKTTMVKISSETPPPADGTNSEDQPPLENLTTLTLRLAFIEEILEEQKRLPQQILRWESAQLKLQERVQATETRLVKELGEPTYPDAFITRATPLHARVESLEQALSQPAELKNRVRRLETQNASTQRAIMSQPRADPSAIIGPLKLQLRQLIAPLEQEVFRLKEADQSDQVFSQIHSIAQRIQSLEQKEKHRTQTGSAGHSSGGWNRTDSYSVSRTTSHEIPQNRHIPSLERQLSEVRDSHRQLYEYVREMARVVKRLIDTFAQHGIEVELSHDTVGQTGVTVDGFREEDD